MLSHALIITVNPSIVMATDVPSVCVQIALVVCFSKKLATWESNDRVRQSRVQIVKGKVQSTRSRVQRERAKSKDWSA
jgi:hypothetical protein